MEVMLGCGWKLLRAFGFGFGMSVCILESCGCVLVLQNVPKLKTYHLAAGTWNLLNTLHITLTSTHLYIKKNEFHVMSGSFL